MEITPSMGSAVPFERNDNARALHNYEPLMDYFGDEIANEPDVIGRWESKLPLAALYIEFREKGPVTILLQKQDEPMQLIRGYWKERDDGSIYILGYRAGWGDMPFEYNLTWSTVNGTLVLEDVDNDYKLLPVYNVMEFEPVSDGWTFPDLSAGPACFFVRSRTLGAYYRYYRFVTGLFGSEREDPVDARFTDYFFVIANGTPATPGEVMETP